MGAVSSVILYRFSQRTAILFRRKGHIFLGPGGSLCESWKIVSGLRTYFRCKKPDFTWQYEGFTA